MSRTAIAALAAVVFVAAGCGGSSSQDQKANEAYASSVCTAIGSWEQDVKNL